MIFPILLIVGIALVIYASARDKKWAFVSACVVFGVLVVLLVTNAADITNV